MIVTHMHWDHADGIDLCPKARIWIQKDKVEYYAREAWQSRGTHGGIDPDDVLTAVRLNTEGRVGLVKGDAQEILPGVTCYTGGKHTYASQFVGVHTKQGTVVLASDNMAEVGTPELHIVLGANEAGKSTALRALRAVLFGMTDMRDAHLHPKDMVRVGLKVQTAD